MHWRLRQVPFLCVLAASLLLTACYRLAQPEATPGGQADTFLPFGNPSGASRADPNNYLLRKSTFVLSYNNSRGTANWIAWRTTRNDLGESIPRPEFGPDPDLPVWLNRVLSSDYSGSGFDRGHLVPSADRFADPAANAETFLMTNIVPQTRDLNQFVWEKLERYTRSIARRGNDVYVMAGAYGDRGKLHNKVTVPMQCWKIIIVLSARSSEINSSTRVIAVDVPNSTGIAGDNWRKYLTSVQSIEQSTGYDFLSAVSPEIQDVLETKLDEASRLDGDR